ncbi:MAG TPA: ATP-binding cassette domain-containing protein [Candidatus Paceibacterota bacterium]|uniref:ABC transporter family protein, ATP-binding cassette, subfamily F, member 3 n=1 Tax=uncultured Parcubacteria bacterium Rifle_16ft_4_minimus_2958 TaxID=1665137 RepID=A0A0H4TMQ9_9BACT|nr:ABC transporter family protein, ATP-binding cassette, subfamily F, member 3 [uncultured Parcubacteria bacterium Rifle_16ft_4_minimus_2958]
MSSNEIVVRFDRVNFEYGHNKHILEEVSFSLRKGMKIALMGQNGAGKSTIFGLINGALQPEAGDLHIGQKLSIAQALQVIPRPEMNLSVRDFFQKRFAKKIYAIDPMIDEALEVVNLRGHEKVHDRIIKTFSGGQQARLLLASAIIQNPDILLLDEPTNNLDKAGIEHLTDFLKNYQKTVVVISHDAEFLNAFTDGVLYLDVYTKKIEQYAGNYNNVVREISARIDKENKKNAQLAKEIQAKKDQANAFAHKGGRLRLVAKRMRNLAEELEEEMVDVRKEDRMIRPFLIPIPEDFVGEAIKITSFSTLGKNHKPVAKKVHVTLRKGNHLLLKGPNGSGKTTLLESIAHGTAKGATITEGVKVGYYRQDFSTLNFEDTVYQSLMAVLIRKDEEYMRSVAAGFLITSEIINTKIGSLSEGQKGLVAFARLVLGRPAILILDEPTNHINFRHLPLIAEALNKYQGAMILVSHVPEFVAKIRIDEVLDLEK